MATNDNPLIDPLDQLRAATASLKADSAEENRVPYRVALKARVLSWLNATEKVLFTREIFASLAWLAVALALISPVFGIKWAAASCALSLAILAHMAMCVSSSAYTVATGFEAIRETYQKDVESTEKKQPAPQAAQPTIAKTQIH